MKTTQEVLPEWNNARQKATGRRASLVFPNVFSGHTSFEEATIVGLRVLRLSVTPQSQQSIAESAAVIAEPAWQAASAELPYLMHWQQSLPARFDFHFDLPEQVRCLGLGERYSGANLRGGIHTLCSTDDTKHDEAMDPMYKAIPFALFVDGDECHGFFLDSPAPQRWDLDSELEGQGKIELLSRLGWRLYAIGPGSIPQVVQAYTELTGRADLPPRWALGHQQCRWSYPDEQTVETIANEFRSRSIPCDTIVLDIDYMDEYRVFTHSAARFPHFNELIKKLSDQHFKVVTIVDPGIKQDPKYDLYLQGKKQELFCKKADGTLFVDEVWPGMSVFPDFLKPETRSWWADHHQFYVNHSIAGIWNDMNEPAFFSNKKPLPRQLDELPPDSQQYFMQQSQGRSVGHFEVRNLYGMMMSRATHEGLTRLQPQKRPFVLSRSGYAGIQRYAAVWLGDNASWWEHLRKSIPMLLNMGLSGVAFAGVDVGGFAGDTSAELLVRWYELGMFYPFFRNHCIMQGRAQEPWAFNSTVENHIRRIIETRYRLLPYIQNLFWEHARSGAPLMRPLIWHYPDDSFAAQIDDQFLFGRDILVAPILEKGRTNRAVYLPAGRWYPINGGQPLEAGMHVLEMPLGQVPAFIREGSIIPLLDVVQHTDDFDQVGITLAVHGDVARGCLFEDDGQSRNYLDGTYNEWNLEFENGTLRAQAVHTGYAAPKRAFSILHRGVKRNTQLI